MIYRGEVVRAKIKYMCSIRGVTVTQLQKACGLGANAVNQIGDKKGISAKALFDISEYLDCTMEYLLGRTDDMVSGHEKPDAIVRAYLTKPLFTELMDTIDGMSDISIQRLIDVAEIIKSGGF